MWRGESGGACHNSLILPLAAFLSPPPSLLTLPLLQAAPTAPAAVGPYDEEEYDGSAGDEDEEEEDEGEEEEGEEEGEEEEEEEDGEGGGRVGGGVQSSWTTLQQATTPPSPTWAPSSLPRPPCALPPRSPFRCK